jgi:arylsulfatase A-like enzyme
MHAMRQRLALVLLSGAACGPLERDPRPSLILISLDSVRADFVGAYGPRLPHAGGRSPTPSLDRLAAEGVVYEDARSTTSWTLPAHVSLLTGVPELVHGVEQDGQSIPPGLHTLAEVLRGAGYRTHGVYSGPYLDPRYGFARGFERYEAGYGPALARAADEVKVASRLVDSIDVARQPERARVAVERRRLAELAQELASRRDTSAERVTDLALAELARAARDERPFFLFAHYFDPHFDYAPPELFARAFDPDYPGTLDARDYFTNPAIAAFDESSPSGRRRVVSERDLEHLRALYAGEIAWTDSQLGRLFDALERRGLARNTLVVVVSDHGDEFFEHGSIGHRRTLFEEVLRVPVILRFPERLAAGERRGRPLALYELLREILALLGAPDAPARDLPSPPVARLVRPEFARLELELDGRALRAEGLRVRILEGFRHETLALLRERSFTRLAEALDPARQRAFEEAGRRERERETLRWIDLAAHPDERDEAWSADFSDPRAREALRRFRASYETLARLRHSPPLVEESAELAAALRGLGYAGQDARLGTLAGEELVLPPPGEGLDPR